MQFRIKRLHPDALIPSYAHPGDAGMDLYAIERTVVPAGKSVQVRTGLAFEIPDGFVGLCWDKSGLSMNHNLKSLAGVLDAGYRGEVVLGIFNFGETDYIFEKHHKVLQMLIQPVVQAEIIELKSDEALSTTSRGEGGRGSTGR